MVRSAISLSFFSRLGLSAQSCASAALVGALLVAGPVAPTRAASDSDAAGKGQPEAGVPARPISEKPPAYPPAAKEAGREGWVQVSYVVEDGRFGDRGVHRGFGRRGRFQAGRERGRDAMALRAGHTRRQAHGAIRQLAPHSLFVDHQRQGRAGQLGLVQEKIPNCHEPTEGGRPRGGRQADPRARPGLAPGHESLRGVEHRGARITREPRPG